MNAFSPQIILGRLAELSPFDISLAETPTPAAGKPAEACGESSPHTVLSEELYGCVDWYRYPSQEELRPENNANPVAKH
jgi:hypothetical protein